MHALLRRLVLGSCLALFTASALGQAEPLDRIIAVVNDQIVLSSELDAEIELVTAQLRQRGGSLPPREAIERQVLERLIAQKLQLAMAERVGIRVDDATLNAATQRIAEQNKLSLSEFRDTLEREGLDYAKFRAGLRKEIALARLHQRQTESQVNVTPQEVEEFLASQGPAGAGTEYLLGHILIATPEQASAEQLEAARAEAAEVQAKADAGEDFGQLAATYSDSGTALEGGSLGWRGQAELPTLFADQVPRLQVGGKVQVTQSPSGFHVIKLLDRRDTGRQVVEQTHARHILIRTNEVVTDADARLRLESLKRRIEGGENFGELARANSDDKGSAVQGGDLGWASPGTYVPAFERTLAQLGPGEISEPFQTRFGWHVVQVLERRQHDSTDEFRRTQAAAAIRQRKSEEVLESWLRRLRDEAYVDIRLES
jgi:peptidyl-prolyl cis-trans isomerase SurA